MGPRSTDKAHQDFISKQLDDVQQQIVDTQDQIAKKQSDLGSLQSAKDLAQTQTDLQTLATKLTLLQTNYANLVSASKNNVANILQIIEPAMVPTKPVGPSKFLISALAGVIGLVLSVGAAYLMEFLDDTFKTPYGCPEIIEPAHDWFLYEPGQALWPEPVRLFASAFPNGGGLPLVKVEYRIFQIGKSVTCNPGDQPGSQRRKDDGGNQPGA